MEYITGAAVFNDWIIVQEIGQGATGHVYEIKKNGHGKEIRSALKVIRIPKSPSDIKAVMSEGMTQEDVTDYFKGFVDEILREIRIMVSLKDHPNIVTYEDHCVIHHEDGIGWDILIKMELLTPIQEWQMDHPMDENEVVRLGCEISSALAYAADHHLIHRDVKPENIFVDSMGRFKLGDFGIARTIEKTTGGLSKKGTESYMAPEVYLGKQYNTQVDIYSLGIVLYRFLNDNRLPFYPPITEKITYSDRETALLKRIQGVPLPEPANGSTEIKRIVLKACQYLPDDRYPTMNELFNDLQQCEGAENKGKWTMHQKPEEQQPKVHKTTEKDPSEQAENKNSFDNGEKIFKLKKVITTCTLAAAVSIGILLYMVGNMSSLNVGIMEKRKSDTEVEVNEIEGMEEETIIEETEEETINEDEAVNNEIKTVGWYYVDKEQRENCGAPLRTAAQKKAPAIYWFQTGTRIYIEKWIDNWGYTSKDGNEGWISLNYLRFSSYPSQRAQGNGRYYQLETNRTETTGNDSVISGSDVTNDSAMQTTVATYAKQMIEMLVSDDSTEEILSALPELSQSRDRVESAVDEWKTEFKEQYGTYRQILEQNITVNTDDVTVASKCEFENGETIITFGFSRENFDITLVGFEWC